jgi:bacterioferritin-associated ferredoxin
MDKTENCNDCPNRFLCYCLRLTASAIKDALVNQQPKTLQDVMQQTGAGSGCTACQRTLKQFLR